ncbi:MAG: molybdopterin molybdenumtransferase MoeA [Betaproteobacteria bacterium]|nr:molybdopterin molybdenumtransferase MoeA [Betaproteobacteria bacterium]
MSTPTTLRDLSSADDYDPNSMPVDKARAHIRAFLSPISGVERLNLRAALGRVLAEDVRSPLDVPGQDNSAMDGYAFRAADLKPDQDTALIVAGTSFAGVPMSGSIGAGQAARIMTGGVVPQGCDTVIMQERVTTEGNTVRIPPGQRTGQNVRKAGCDIKRDAVVFATGQILRPSELGMIASLGIGEISVYRKLRVVFFSTGDELVSIGHPLAVGQIYDSNRYTLHGMLTRMGVEVLDMGVIRDDPASIENAFSSASEIADVVITSGGVSVGEADFVKQILDKLGEVLFWKIAMKPGRPLAYGKLGKAHFFGLPGNPVSSMVTFYQFVREALLVLAGAHPAPIPLLKATCTDAIKKAPGRTEFQRGILSQGADGQWSVRPTGDQGSAVLSSMSLANCFIVLPDAQGNTPPGTIVGVQLLEGFF